MEPAPELVDPATASADPAPVEGQQVATTPDATPPQTYKIGDEEYDSETLTDYIGTAKNAKAMHKSAHEEYTAAKALREEIEAARNDPKRKRLDYILDTIEHDPRLANEWRQLEQTTFDSGGAPTNALAYAAQLREIREQVAKLQAEKDALAADDYIGQFATSKGITKEQAEEVTAKFLADTKREDFPDTNALSHLQYYYWDKYEREGAEAKLSAAKAEGYTEAIARVKAGQAAELGSPATHTEVPWQPSKDAADNPMLESFDAAMADESIRFD